MDCPIFDVPETLNINKQNHSLTLISEHHQSTTKDLIWLPHYRLSHPSFKTLAIIFPFLLKGLENKPFVCEVCELAKHKRSAFPIINKRSLVPFELIHSDIWGPSPILSISGAC